MSNPRMGLLSASPPQCSDSLGTSVCAGLTECVRSTAMILDRAMFHSSSVKALVTRPCVACSMWSSTTKNLQSMMGVGITWSTWENYINNFTNKYRFNLPNNLIKVLPVALNGLVLKWNIQSQNTLKQIKLLWSYKEKRILTMLDWGCSTSLACFFLCFL